MSQLSVWCDMWGWSPRPSDRPRSYHLVLHTDRDVLGPWLLPLTSVVSQVYVTEDLCTLGSSSQLHVDDVNLPDTSLKAIALSKKLPMLLMAIAQDSLSACPDCYSVRIRPVDAEQSRNSQDVGLASISPPSCPSLLSYKYPLFTPNKEAHCFVHVPFYFLFPQYTDLIVGVIPGEKLRHSLRTSESIIPHLREDWFRSVRIPTRNHLFNMQGVKPFIEITVIVTGSFYL